MQYVPMDIPGVYYGVSTWGDCDNDGDLDLFMSGYSTDVQGPYTELFMNQGSGLFKPMDLLAHTESLSPGEEPCALYMCDADWGDYDNDGDLDLIIIGKDKDGYPHTHLYTNQGDGTFQLADDVFNDNYWGEVSWGDYNGDGKTDLVINGVSGTHFYRNNGNGMFHEIDLDISESVGDGTVDWGDYDNDGDLDLLIMGDSETMVYSYVGGDQFIKVDTDMPGGQYSCARWGDWDGDGALDIALSGYANNGLRTYMNNTLTGNNPPTSPDDLQLYYGSEHVVFHWDVSNDLESRTRSLTYNLRIGTTPGGEEIKSAMSAADGTPRTVRRGNVDHITNWPIRLDNLGRLEVSDNIYWAVQALDNGYKGSPFSGEDMIELSGEIASVMDIPYDQGGKVILRWDASDLDHHSDLLTYYSIWRRITSGAKSASELIDIKDFRVLIEKIPAFGADIHWLLNNIKTSLVDISIKQGSDRLFF